MNFSAVVCDAILYVLFCFPLLNKDVACSSQRTMGCPLRSSLERLGYKERGVLLGVVIFDYSFMR
jgi:hypothetical protein